MVFHAALQINKVCPPATGSSPTKPNITAATSTKSSFSQSTPRALPLDSLKTSSPVVSTAKIDLQSSASVSTTNTQISPKVSTIKVVGESDDKSTRLQSQLSTNISAISVKDLPSPRSSSSTPVPLKCSTSSPSISPHKSTVDTQQQISPRANLTRSPTIKSTKGDILDKLFCEMTNNEMSGKIIKVVALFFPLEDIFNAIQKECRRHILVTFVFKTVFLFHEHEH